MRVLKFLVEVSKPYRLYLWFVVFTMIFIAADKNIKPYLIKVVIDYVSINDYYYIWIVIAIYAAIQFGVVLAWSFTSWCENKYSPQLTSHITKSLLQKLSIYPYRFFQEHLAGSIAHKVNDAAKRSATILDVIMIELFQISIMLIISIILLSRVHYGFGIAMALWVSIFIALGYINMKKINVLSSTEAESDAKLRGGVVDYLTNMFSVKIFASFSYEQKRLDHSLKDFVSKSRTKGLALRSYLNMQGTVFSCYIVLCLCGLVYLSQINLITPGDFALVLLLNIEIVNWLFSLTHILKDFITNWGAVDQALVILEEVPDIQDNPNAEVLHVNKGEIVFDKVKFHYKDAEPLFQDKSVTIASGQKVGLVGYSGGGKSTFVNLILRLYDVTDGHIMIDGQDIASVSQNSLREAIAMIPQDPSLFHRTLMENIHYGRIEASVKEVVEASRKAHAHEFIKKLPQGYESLVGERGVKLSGGQRQRIAIARAILKNAPILILDEATSQLDSVTESDIQESLWELIQGKTTIVIAHRLSTLLHMDRILVFDQGKIVEDGNHKELLARNGLYKTLWDAQVGGFLPDKND